MLARWLAPQPLEHRKPVLVAGDSLAIHQARTHLELVHGLDDERIARCPIVPVLVSRWMPIGSRRAISRYPSCLISWIQPGPLGGRSAEDGRQGSIKPEGSGPVRDNIRKSNNGPMLGSRLQISVGAASFRYLLPPHARRRLPSAVVDRASTGAGRFAAAERRPLVRYFGRGLVVAGIPLSKRLIWRRN
jgi:hypothetical protein